MRVSLNHPVLNALRDKGIAFNVVGDHIELDGFGKSGIVRLTAHPDIEGLLLHSRYERVVPALTIKDVYAEAWHWFGITISRMGGTYAPHENWRKAFIEMGWLPEGWPEYSGVTRDQWHEAEEKRKCCMSV